MQLTDLLEKSLEGFTVQELTEVYELDVEGRQKIKSIGFFRDENVAKAFAQNQTDANYHRTQKVIVLTNGEIGFVIGEPVILLNDEKAALEVREKALAKLSPEERRLLKL